LISFFIPGKPTALQELEIDSLKKTVAELEIDVYLYEVRFKKLNNLLMQTEKIIDLFIDYKAGES
jgi:uncharacterized coiled-coil protein SlyX